MKHCYIFSYFKKYKLPEGETLNENHQVIFFPYKNVKTDLTEIKVQLRDYFQANTLPNKLIVICFEFNKNDIKEIFNEKSDLYDYIPKFDHNNQEEFISVISLNKKGEWEALLGKKLSESDINYLYTAGLTKIFLHNGGLITSQPSNHFVFPSGKHSDKFLRTGNVLISGNEILFIASALVFHFKKSKVESIYSDTSSINSLAFAYVNLLKELNENFKESVLIESFGSYKMFEKQKFNAKRSSIFLISSSTSGSILDRMVKDNLSKNIDINNVVILFGLTINKHFQKNIICDLTNSNVNPNGLEPINTYNVKKGKTCKFCLDGSKPLKVEGDVFLLEKPLVKTVLLKKTDLPRFVKSFSAYYKKNNKEDDSIVKCYFKENSFKDKKYEIYIDIPLILKEWSENNDKSLYKNIFLKLEKYILQNIPASLKYILTLPDEGSKELAKIIANVLKSHGVPFDINNIIGIESQDILKIDKEGKGTIAIISSSVVSGRNLLYLSRALRDFEKSYQRIFFNLINRTNNQEQYDFLQSNLGLGEFGINTHKIFNVETIFCTNEAINTSWHQEYKKMLEFQDFCDERIELIKFRKFCDERVIELSESGKYKGLCDNLFFPDLKFKKLKIRSGFAFAPFETGTQHQNFITRAKQSEIYFILSSILNNLRNKGTLNQSEYVRTTLDPGNFIRYNDGIIQTCLLRATKTDELNYSLSDDLSLQMKAILGDMIIHIKDEHAEALNEFFYAIAIRKLKLIKGIVEDCILLLEEQDTYKKQDSILKGLVEYIKSNVLEQEELSERFKKLSKPKVLND